MALKGRGGWSRGIGDPGLPAISACDYRKTGETLFVEGVTMRVEMAMFF